MFLDPKDLEALQDTVELLADPDAREEIERARREVAEGRGIRADELLARYRRHA